MFILLTVYYLWPLRGLMLRILWHLLCLNALAFRLHCRLLWSWWIECPPTSKHFYPQARVRELTESPKTHHPKNRKKPQWVVDEVIFLLALTDKGTGRVANLFNLRHAHSGESVSKTFVYSTWCKHRYQVWVMRKDLRRKPPRAIPVNYNWALDMTTVTLDQRLRCVLGILDQGSRMCLALVEMKSKHSWCIVREIIKAVRLYGLPKMIKTDNEACFTSKIMAWTLKLLSIRHSTTQHASPWQNGRIERFFGTFKEKWRQLDFSGCADLQTELAIYQAWYNCVRPHQNLNGLTPKEVFRGRRYKNTEPLWTSAWHGVLAGYFFPD